MWPLTTPRYDLGRHEQASKIYFHPASLPPSPPRHIHTLYTTTALHHHLLITTRTKPCAPLPAPPPRPRSSTTTERRHRSRAPRAYSLESRRRRAAGAATIAAAACNYSLSALLPFNSKTCADCDLRAVGFLVPSCSRESEDWLRMEDGESDDLSCDFWPEFCHLIYCTMNGASEVSVCLMRSGDGVKYDARCALWTTHGIPLETGRELSL
ncbi:hypothetical protein BZA05DRAFT_401855 [Tricharina praecox]|uniref:uncharacterized protein n=1 Tax=Tricharina praecox TaxID=43433 RepID=UPI00221EC237|nr:uncharacterized protein BZA05DRAFT_401855 [Tricharina praecox]KAI5849887.1 hypothetical protein BZA05DRAFT_401855 [Tricharina praecox]